MVRTCKTPEMGDTSLIHTLLSRRKAHERAKGFSTKVYIED